MAQGNLLITDDEPIILKMLKMNLADHVEKIFTAENGREALAVLEKEEIHCIVCDINMPVMNGVELIKEVRARGIQLPFIFYTAHGERELMLEAVKYGAFDFLNKPNLDGLEEVVLRGLKAGSSPSAEEDISDDQLSEYKKLLKELN